MESSPPGTDGKARAIRELSRSLNHSPRSIPSLSPPPSDSNPTRREHHFATGTSDIEFFNNDDILMSTQHRIDDETTNPLPTHRRLRSTAKKYGSWQMPRSEQPVLDTSMVDKEFGDFDHSVSDEDDMSIEQARGGNRSNRSTPGKLNSSFAGFNSLYDITPPSTRTRKSYAPETGSLRRDAQIRRASQKDLDTASPRHESTRNSPAAGHIPERRRTTLGQMHAKVSEDESSFVEERPPTVTFQAKTTRFSRSRQASAQLDGTVGTPPRSNGTPRSAPMTAQNATAQSFMLPDLPNLTELVSGVFQDGTPVFSKAAPARSRFTAPHNTGRAGGRQPNHIPVDNVPIPEDDKAILASLQLLKEKVAQLEHERAEAEKKIEEQDIEIIELRAENEAQQKLRRSDSALGSTDGEGSGGKGSWKFERTRLETSVGTLQKRLDRAERKLSVSEIANKRITSDRDNLVSQLSVAFQKFEEVKIEKEALRAENDTLRQEVDSLRAENDALRDQLEQDQEQFRGEILQLRRQIDQNDNIVRKENQTFRAELARVRAQHDEGTQNLARKEVELRKARKEQAEYAKLKADNDVLKAQMANLKAKREEEARRWASRESELKGRIERRDETIRHFQDMTQEQTNEALRLDNDNLRTELAQLSAQHEDENQRWARKEAQLRRKIEKREGAVRQMEDMTREVLSIRQANGQQPSASYPASADKENDFRGTTAGIQRKSSKQREDTRTRIANRVQQEVRNSRSVSATQPPSQPERSPRKSYTRLPSQSLRSSLPADFSRSVSAPVPGSKHTQADSDAESTTDLSLAPRGTPFVMHGGASGMPATTATIEPPAALDLTGLSFIDGDYIAQLRQKLEEERAAGRKKASSTPVERQSREDTVRSVASAKSTRQQSLPRKSSMKDLTERTNATVFEDLTGHISHHEGTAAPELTQTKQSVADASMLSSTSRRRRSAPVEMTSAFIVPDITIHHRKQSTRKIDFSQKIEIPRHDNDNCTVCRRTAKHPSAGPLTVPKLVPVSERMPDDVDATLRPARSPKEALALVVKELQDELAHLHLELAAHQALLQAHDVSLGKKKRLAIQAAIEDLLKLIAVKSDQVYNLFDVLEGQNEHEITEQDVEDITREIRMEEEAVTEKKGEGKRVTIQSYVESESEEEELPWEGFEDTGSLRMEGLTGMSGRRGSAY
ncbi:hypothetical protein K469DRAFT_728736 [Zopfia rhizophila CBS 207.26]|uniref:Cep57 centrosome microtubule-binding domain-containing protein n=1 Tax=Zopfia rhizophila CBS 207.26 TaxID=1314779 RepID=A0A6A6EQH3_9PEZI|nr:hypothetical protein K469DRAFT_728736 [Zopfia rhizophila CBS 207.26]